MLNLLATVVAAADGDSTSGGGNNSMIIILIVGAVLLVGMFVFNFFSSKKQRKAEAERLKSLKPGDKVLMSCGIKGTIVEVNEISPVDTFVVIRTGSDQEPCTLTFDIRAVYRTFDDNNAADETAKTEETAQTDDPVQAEEQTKADETTDNAAEDKQ